MNKKKICEKINEENVIISNNSKLINIFEEKINSIINKIWID